MDLGDLFLRFIENYHEVLRDADSTGMQSSGLPDITIHQFFYLEEIKRQGQTTLTTLAQALNVSKPSATAVVTKLTRDGFISRTRSPDDQRVFYLAVTEKGEEIFEKKNRAYRAFIEMVERTTSKSEQDILIQAFTIMDRCFHQNGDLIK